MGYEEVGNTDHAGDKTEYVILRNDDLFVRAIGPFNNLLMTSRLRMAQMHDNRDHAESLATLLSKRHSSFTFKVWELALIG